MGKAKVAALRVRPETVLDDITRLFELAGLEQTFAAGAVTLLDREVVSRHHVPAANTTPWQLDGGIRALRAAGAGELRVSPLAAAARDAALVERQNHYRAVLDRHAVSVQSARGADEPRLVEYRPRASLHVLHELFPAGIFLPEDVFGKNLLCLPTMKCDAHVGIGGALRRGLSLLGRRRHAVQGSLDRALVDLWAIRREIHPGRFALMDGTTAGNGAGPRGLVPVVKDLMLASSDFVALDAVAAKVMGLEPSGIACIRLAHEAGLGVGDVREIELVGDDVSGENWHFSSASGSGASRAARLANALASRAANVWLGPLRPLHELASRTPAAAALALGDQLYHDQYRWLRHDRRTFERWRGETRWGRLFAAYADGGRAVSERRA
jgi:uncharacterized protein DUF362